MNEALVLRDNTYYLLESGKYTFSIRNKNVSSEHSNET